MPRKDKTRRLWLNVRWKIAHKPSRETILKRLLESVENGTYDLPKSYKVQLGWRNKELAAMKWGEWKSELTDSAGSSDGFDLAVISYLKGQGA